MKRSIKSMGSEWSKPVEYIKGKIRPKDSGDKSQATHPPTRRPLDIAQHPTGVSGHVDTETLTSTEAVAVDASRQVLGPKYVEVGESVFDGKYNSADMGHFIQESDKIIAR